MNIGKLVRERMKKMSVDCSGDYVDNVGKHFEMKKCESGAYTVSYGGEAKKEIELEAGEAMKLVAACKKLGGAADDKKELATGAFEKADIRVKEVSPGRYVGVVNGTIVTSSNSDRSQAKAAAVKWAHEHL